MATLLNIDFTTAVNGTAYNVVSYIRTPHGPDAADPQNPYVVATDQVQIAGGRLAVRGADANASLAGVSFGGFGPETAGWWNATQACLTAIYEFQAGYLADVNIGPLVSVMKNELQVAPLPFVLLLDDNEDGTRTLDLLAQGWDANIADTSVIFTDAELIALSSLTLQVEWQCGTVSPGFTDVAHDGFLRVFWNGTQIINKVNVDLFISDDQGGDNWANGVSLGYSGLNGKVSRLTVRDSLCPTTVIDSTVVCGCTGTDPDIVSDGGGTGGGASPVQTPTIGAQIVCVGNGMVPTQADLTFAESWWGA